MALTDKLTAVADAIRGKTGKTEPLTLDQMPGEIAGIVAGGGGLIYDMGEFVLDEDTLTSNFTVPHNLGEVPEFICVWTDHWAGLTSDNPVSYDDAKQTAAGCIWLEKITGMTYRASSSASGTPFCVNMYIADGDYRVGGTLPTSATYGMRDGYVTGTTFKTINMGTNGPRYRAGVTYNYFVSKAWWSVGGAANAE
jgi:hypothetical protein